MSSTYDAIVTNEEKSLDGVTGAWRCQCMTPEGANKQIRVSRHNIIICPVYLE